MKSKPSILFLFTLILFSLCLRLSKIGQHETISLDSWDYHSRAESLIANGNEGRYSGFFSFFGWYANSDPLGAMYLLSSVSIVTGLNNGIVMYEISVLVVSQSIAIFGIMNMFLLSRALIPDNRIALTSSLIFSLSRTFLPGTLWVYSYRVVLLSFFPIFLFVIIRAINRVQTSKNLFISLMFLFCLLSMHRASIFTIVVIFSAILTVALYNNRIKRFRISLIENNKFKFSLFVILPIFALYFLYTGSFYEIGRQNFSNYYQFLDNVLNLSISYGMSLGIILVFFPFGFYKILGTSPLKKESSLLILLSFFYVPFGQDIQYAILYFHTLMILLCSIGFVTTINDLVKSTSRDSVLVVLLLIIFIAPNYIEIKEDDQFQMGGTKFGSELQPEVYNCGIYMRHFNEEEEGVSFTGIPQTNIGYIAGTSNHQLPSFFSHQVIFLNDWKKIISGKEETFWNLEVGGFSDSDSGIYWSVLRPDREWSDPEVLLSLKLNLHGNDLYYVGVNPFNENKVVVPGGSYELLESPFLRSVNEDMYKIYQNDYNSIRYLNYN